MRKLKNYLLYKKKLLDFASAFEISVTYKQLNGNATAEYKKITIDSALTQSSEIATLLHELGHILDDLSFTVEEYNKISAAYKVIYNSNSSKKQKATVLEREKAAWKYGKNLAAQLNIHLGKWFHEEQRVCLKTYKKD